MYRHRVLVRWTVRLLLLLTGSSAALVVMAWMAGTQLVAPSSRRVGEFPASLLPPHAKVDDLILESAQGKKLAAWYVTVPESRGTVLLLHPIRADRRAMLGRAVLLLRNGFSCLLVDLQAHGESDGDRITLGFLESQDVEVAVDWIRQRTPNQRIALLGWSLGGAAALLSSPLSIDALILESVYSTVEQATRNRVAHRIGPLSRIVSPLLLAQLSPRLGVTRSQLRPLEKIAVAGCPLLLMAGDVDPRTTIEETRAMYRRAKSPKRIEIFPGAGHQDLLQFDSDRYHAAVLDFLSEHFP